MREKHHDKKKFKLNPITGQLDLVQEFNSSRIITHRLSEFANPIVFFDPVQNLYYEAYDQVVTDSNGNVLVM